MNQNAGEGIRPSQLLKLDKKVQPVITGEVDALTDYHNARNVKFLSNRQYDYRLRIGHYRVLFDVVNEVVEIVLTRIGISQPAYSQMEA